MPDEPVKTNLSEDQLARLPKKVRQDIERLVSSANWWKDKAQTGPEDTDTFADAFWPGEGKPLPRGCAVLFHHGPGDRDFVRVKVNRTSGSVEVHADAVLTVRPQSSNVINVRSEQR